MRTSHLKASKQEELPLRERNQKFVCVCVCLRWHYVALYPNSCWLSEAKDLSYPLHMKSAPVTIATHSNAWDRNIFMGLWNHAHKNQTKLGCVCLGPSASLYLLIRDTESNPLDHSDQTVYFLPNKQTITQHYCQSTVSATCSWSHINVELYCFTKIAKFI